MWQEKSTENDHAVDRDQINADWSAGVRCHEDCPGPKHMEAFSPESDEIYIIVTTFSNVLSSCIHNIGSQVCSEEMATVTRVTSVTMKTNSR